MYNDGIVRGGNLPLEERKNTSLKVNRGTQTDVFSEIDIWELLLIFARKAWLILLVGILCAGIAFAFSYYTKPDEYQSSIMVYVNAKDSSITDASFSAGDITSGKSLVGTYLVILRARTTLERIINTAGVDMTYSELSDKVTAGAVDDTGIIRVTVTTSNPELSKLLANTIAIVLPDRVAEIINGSSVRAVDDAITPTSKSGPNITKDAFIGFIIGVVVVCAILFVMYMLDVDIHDESDVTEMTDLPILAAIPDLLAEENRGYGKYGKYGRYGRSKYGYGYGNNYGYGNSYEYGYGYAKKSGDGEEK